MIRFALSSLALAAGLGSALAQAPVEIQPASRPPPTVGGVQPAPTVQFASAPKQAASGLSVAERTKAALMLATCSDCGTVQEVKQETRKGKGGALGMIGGAVAGGLLGSQVGSGSGKDIATVGGAVGGAVVGNEVQKRLSSKKVWVTSVQMRDGSVRQFEQEAQPSWVAGHVVRVHEKTLSKP